MLNKQDFFTNRELLIVTKHKKEQVIAPLFEKALGVRCVVSQKFDTDTLGTFSGEISRKYEAFETLRQKCLQAMELEGHDLAIATEGSFGNHPTVFFAPANEEMILLLDKKNKIQIGARLVSLATNFDGQELNSKEALDVFLKKIQFPSHGVIIKDKEHNWNSIVKGICDYDTLDKIVANYFDTQSSFFVSTDMRAMFNPTRMNVIEEVCVALLQKIQSYCPNCQYPGFGVVRAEAGLPCSFCAQPTRSTAAQVYQCEVCAHEQINLFPNNKHVEDPAFCDYCNP